MKTINEIKKEIEKLEIILKRTPISTEKFREAMKKQQIKKAQLQTSQNILDEIENYNKHAKESLCNNLNTKTDTLCYFGQLGLMTINELVDTFLGEELKSKINGEKEK